MARKPEDVQVDHPLAEKVEQACVEAFVHQQEVLDSLVVDQVCDDHERYLALICLVAADYPVMYVDVGLAVVLYQTPGSCHSPPDLSLHVCDGLSLSCQASVGKHQTDCPTSGSLGSFVVVGYVLWLSHVNITGTQVTGDLTFLLSHFRQGCWPMLFLWRFAVHGHLVIQRWSAPLSVVAEPIVILIIASLRLLLRLLRLLLKTWVWVRSIIVLGVILVRFLLPCTLLVMLVVLLGIVLFVAILIALTVLLLRRRTMFFAQPAHVGGRLR